MVLFSRQIERNGPARILSHLLLISRLIQSVTTLEVIKGSNCSSVCSPNSATPSTSGNDEINCFDDAYNKTAVGQKYQNCLTCELQSTETDPVNMAQTNLGWAFYNLRYTASWFINALASACQTNPSSSSPFAIPPSQIFTLNPPSRYPTSTTKASSTSHSLSKSAIIAIAVVIPFVLIMGIGGFGFYWYRRVRNLPSSGRHPGNLIFDERFGDPSISSPLSGKSNLKTPSKKQYISSEPIPLTNHQYPPDKKDSTYFDPATNSPYHHAQPSPYHKAQPTPEPIMEEYAFHGGPLPEPQTSPLLDTSRPKPRPEHLNFNPPPTRTVDEEAAAAKRGGGIGAFVKKIASPLSSPKENPDGSLRSPRGKMQKLGQLDTVKVPKADRGWMESPSD
ncbi:hypothetical protein MMC09_002267 [Bachmanniomyces sp. S44760]|nr:hypothetical protein [Bachmanniomyces sp. S44760]